MADRYLLESGAPDGYQLEDASGVLLLEAVGSPFYPYFWSFRLDDPGVWQFPTSRNANLYTAATTTSVVRAPFVVPNPPYSHRWQGKPVGSELTLLLVAQQPTPFVPNQFNFDYNESAPFWAYQGQQNELLYQPSVAPFISERRDLTVIDPPVWQFQYNQNELLLVKPFIPHFPDLTQNDYPVWNWQSQKNEFLPATNLRPFNWSSTLGLDDNPTWTWKPGFNEVLNTPVAAPFKSFFWSFNIDDPPVWQQTYGSNLSLTAQPIVQPPTPRWQYNYSDDPAWLRTTYLNLALLSAPVLAAAPTKLWNWNFDDHPNWRKVEYRNLALLTAPVLAAFPNKFWRYDYYLDEPIWVWTAPYASALTLPPAEEVPPTVGGRGLRNYPARRVDLSKRERGFSRKYFDELQAAWEAQAELERRAEKEEQAKKRTALAKAAREAEDALLAVENAEIEVTQQLKRITRTVHAANEAKSLVQVIAASQRIIAASIAAQRKIEDEDDEEETLLLLLS